MTIAFNGFWGTTQTNATTCVLVTHAPLVGDCLISWCLSNNGLPSIADSLSGAWSSVVALGGPTGGSRNYSLYQAIQPNVASNASRTITWTGGASGQITGAACHVGGLATSTPYDTAATPLCGTGNSGSLLSNNSNLTSFPNEIVFAVGSVDTSSSGTYTIGNIAGTTGTTTSCTSASSGSAPNIFVGYNIVSATGNYSGAATYTVSAHWIMQVVSFADTNISPGGGAAIAWTT
jgi:hypothetical protein